MRCWPGSGERLGCCATWFPSPDIRGKYRVNRRAPVGLQGVVLSARDSEEAGYPVP
jgi:hypothetical protein